MAPYNFWLFAAVKKHVKGIHVTSDEEIISRTARRILHRRVRTLTALCRTGGELRVQMRHGSKVHISSFSFCFVSFLYLCLDVKIRTWRNYFPNVLLRVVFVCVIPLWWSYTRCVYMWDQTCRIKKVQHTKRIFLWLHLFSLIPYQMLVPAYRAPHKSFLE